MAKPLGVSSTIHTVQRQTLGDHVYEQLRESIIRGDIPAGTQLNQVELAVRLGVSRVPVREALRRLQAERFLDANPFQRYVVTSLSREQVLELFDLRVELEVFAALRSVRRPDFTTVVLPDARRAASALDPKMGVDEWLEGDMDFHRAVNGRDSGVSVIIDEVRSRIYRYLHLARADLNRRREVIVEHDQILAAIESGDEARIREVITGHVQHTRDRLASEGAGDS